MNGRDTMKGEKEESGTGTGTGTIKIEKGDNDNLDIVNLSLDPPLLADDFLPPYLYDIHDNDSISSLPGLLGPSDPVYPFETPCGMDDWPIDLSLLTLSPVEQVATEGGRDREKERKEKLPGSLGSSQSLPRPTTSTTPSSFSTISNPIPSSSSFSSTATTATVSEWEGKGGLPPSSSPISPFSPPQTVNPILPRPSGQLGQLGQLGQFPGTSNHRMISTTAPPFVPSRLPLTGNTTLPATTSSTTKNIGIPRNTVLSRKGRGKRNDDSLIPPLSSFSSSSSSSSFTSQPSHTQLRRRQPTKVSIPKELWTTKEEANERSERKRVYKSSQDSEYEESDESDDKKMKMKMKALSNDNDCKEGEEEEEDSEVYHDSENEDNEEDDNDEKDNNVGSVYVKRGRGRPVCIFHIFHSFSIFSSSSS